MQEFKVGDRVRLDGVVVKSRGGCGVAGLLAAVRLAGDGSGEWHGITHEAMKHATIIQPEQEKKVPEKMQELDVIKPMRKKGYDTALVYVGPLPDGRIVCSSMSSGSLWTGLPSEFENIPAPKRTMSREVVMVEGWDTLLFASSMCAAGLKILARGTITLVEGDGMGEAQP